MFAIKEVRQVKLYSPMTQGNVFRNLNICIAPNGNEMACFGSYRYLSKDGKTLTNRYVSFK